ncbi:MAG: hypothetical protein ACRDLP_00350 [Solirubrobacteraceae bacterium]
MRGPWPARARAAVAGLLARQRAVVRIVDAAAASADLMRWRLDYRRGVRGTSAAGQAVRRQLHAPAFNL